MPRARDPRPPRGAPRAPGGRSAPRWRGRVAALLVLLAGGAAAAQDPAPSPPPRPKGLLRIRLAEGERLRFSIREHIRIVTPLRNDREEVVEFERAAEGVVLGAAKEGGTDLRVRFTRAQGFRRDSHFGGGEAVPFDSEDPARNLETAPELVRGCMGEVGRGIDLTLTPRGEVTNLRAPADGSPAHFLFTKMGDNADVAALVRADFQKLFAVLPEKEVAVGGSWIVRHGSWDPPCGRDLGPFALKFTVRQKDEFLHTMKIGNGETKRPAKGGSQKGVAKRDKDPSSGPPKDFDYGPFELEVKGEATVDPDSGMLMNGNLELTLVQKQWQLYTAPLLLPIDYFCEVECVPVREK